MYVMKSYVWEVKEEQTWMCPGGRLTVLESVDPQLGRSA